MARERNKRRAPGAGGKGKGKPGRPSSATLQGLRTALAEEQSRTRLMAAERDSARTMLMRSMEQRNQLQVDYQNHKAVCQGDRNQLVRLAQFINTHYQVWEHGVGRLLEVDVAIHYLLEERGRWWVKLRSWWHRWRGPSGSEYPSAQWSLMPWHQWARRPPDARNAAGGFYCQNCSRVLVDKQGDYCEKCLKVISDLAERAR